MIRETFRDFMNGGFALVTRVAKSKRPHVLVSGANYAENVKATLEYVQEYVGRETLASSVKCMETIGETNCINGMCQEKDVSSSDNDEGGSSSSTSGGNKNIRVISSSFPEGEKTAFLTYKLSRSHVEIVLKAKEVNDYLYALWIEKSSRTKLDNTSNCNLLHEMKRRAERRINGHPDPTASSSSTLSSSATMQESTKKRDKFLVVIFNAELLTMSGQKSLHRLVEKGSSRFHFVFVTSNASCMNNALCSRLFRVRIPVTRPFKDGDGDGDGQDEQGGSCLSKRTFPFFLSRTSLQIPGSMAYCEDTTKIVRQTFIAVMDDYNDHRCDPISNKVLHEVAEEFINNLKEGESPVKIAISLANYVCFHLFEKSDIASMYQTWVLTAAIVSKFHTLPISKALTFYFSFVADLYRIVHVNRVKHH
jgi:hypothetical protein